MLGEGKRGALLEMTLAKVLYVSSEYMYMYATQSVFQPGSGSEGDIEVSRLQGCMSDSCPGSVYVESAEILLIHF